MAGSKGETGDLLAIFPVKQYLGDVILQKTIAGLMRSGDVKQADLQKLAPFHPLGAGDLKQKVDMDVYCVMGVHGQMIRTHVVINNGLALTNPPPEDFLCDSCHRKGWLMKRYQDSKIDGANIPVWLCPDCMRLKPEERDVRF